MKDGIHGVAGESMRGGSLHAWEWCPRKCKRTVLLRFPIHVSHVFARAANEKNRLVCVMSLLTVLWHTSKTRTSSTAQNLTVFFLK